MNESGQLNPLPYQEGLALVRWRFLDSTRIFVDIPLAHQVKVYKQYSVETSPCFLRVYTNPNRENITFCMV